jgi:hypothetical protein
VPVISPAFETGQGQVRLFLLIICCGILSRSQQSRKHQLRYFIRAQGFFAQQFFGHGLHGWPIVFDQVSCADVCNSEPSVKLLHGSGDEFQQIGSLQEIRVSNASEEKDKHRFFKNGSSAFKTLSTIGRGAGVGQSHIQATGRQEGLGLHQKA